MLDKLRKRGQ